MDEESHSTSQDSSEAVQMNTSVSLHIVNLREVHCALCETIYSPGNEANRHLNVCQVLRESRQHVEDAWQVIAETRRHLEENRRNLTDLRLCCEEVLQGLTEIWRDLEEIRRNLEENRWISEELRQRIEPHRQRVERCLEDLPRLVITEEHDVQMNTGVSLPIVNLREVHCALCETIYSPGNEANRHLNVCQVLRESQQRAEEVLQGIAETRRDLEENRRNLEENRRIFAELRLCFEEALQGLAEIQRDLEENRQNLEENRWISEELRQRFEPHRQRVERCLEDLPRLVITEEHEKKHNGLQCAICLDPLPVGSIVNQLPCLHFFHPFCLVSWLKVRMSCPTCRYKLSTAFDNETMQNSNRRIGFQEIVHEGSSVNSSSVTFDVNEPEVVVSESYNETTDSSVRDREGSRVGWFLFAAASIVGIALFECFQNFLGDGRGRGFTGHVEYPRQCQPQVRMLSSGSSSTRRSNSRENT